MKRGRRPGSSSTRSAILEAARREFAERGYDRATLRSIASRAGVDPATIYHFFQSKDGLLRAALELPVAEEAFDDLFPAGQPVAATDLLETLLGLWQDPDVARRIVALVRVAATHPDAARVVHDLLDEAAFRRLAAGIDADQPELRAALVASQVAGLVLLRLVLPSGPLADAAPADLVAAVAPTVERYLSGDLGSEGPRGRLPRAGARPGGHPSGSSPPSPDGSR